MRIIPRSGLLERRMARFMSWMCSIGNMRWQLTAACDGLLPMQVIKVFLSVTTVPHIPGTITGLKHSTRTVAKSGPIPKFQARSFFWIAGWGPDGNIYAARSGGLGVFSSSPNGELRWATPEDYSRPTVNYAEIQFGRSPDGGQQLYFSANAHTRAI